jgi:hypothetical protein
LLWTNGRGIPIADRNFDVNPMRRSADQLPGEPRDDDRYGFARAAIGVNDMDHEWLMNDRGHRSGISCFDDVHDINVIHEHECDERGTRCGCETLCNLRGRYLADGSPRATSLARIMCREYNRLAGLETLFTM